MASRTSIARAASEPPEGVATADPPSSPKGRRTRERVILAAQAVFERDGFVASRISDIAAAAGVAHGTFYSYFASKEEVFREIIGRIHNDMVGATTSTASRDCSPARRIEDANRTYIAAWRRNARMMATIEQVVTLNADIRELRREVRRPFVDRNARAIRRWQAQGLADPGLDPVYAANALGAMVDKFMHTWMVLGEDFEEETAVRTLTRLWVRALGMDPD